jgi:hypothetical protein
MSRATLAWITMSRHWRGFVAFLAMVLAASCSEPSADDGSPIPPGCEDLFEQGNFGCSSPEICEYLEQNPDRVARWRATLEPGDDLERKRECMEGYLEAAGLDEAATFYTDSVAVETTYTDIEPICRAAMVRNCSATAPSDRCGHHDEPACAADPLCGACIGYKLDEQEACFMQDVFALCRDQDATPQGLTVPYVGPDGSCWSGDCLHSQPGFTPDPEAAYCPYLGGHDAPPICGG